MADPLSLLRKFNIEKKEIMEKDGQIIFGKSAWPKNVKTNYIIWGTDKNTAKRDYYTLECLLFLLNNSKMTHPVYIRKAAIENIPVVVRPDRKAILAYLNGETSCTPSIDKSAIPIISTKIKRSLCNDESEPVYKKPNLELTHLHENFENISANLDSHHESTDVSVEHYKSLLETISAEKIAEIKAKRLAKKKNITKGDRTNQEEYDFGTMLELEGGTSNRERQLRTRNIILQASKKNFADSILPMLKNLEARAAGTSGLRLQKYGPVSQPTPVIRTVQPPIYNRYDQERFNKLPGETEEFNIDTMGSYHGRSLKSVTEDHVGNRQPPKPSSDASKSSLKQRRGKKISRTPIVIIPAGTKSLISMYNAKDILEELKFVTIEDKKANGTKRDNEILIQRRKNVGTVPYRVIDNPNKLSLADWERVVAVFVMGPMWQFKGYPWSNPPEIFAKVAAFHLKYDDMPLDENVAKWAVTVIEISRTKRHLDRAAMLGFWKTLDQHIAQFKYHLRS